MSRVWLLSTLVAAIAACDSAAAPNDILSEPAFSFEATGEVRSRQTGVARMLNVLPGGFSVVNDQGVRTEYSVTPILLADTRSADAPQLHIGILNDVRPGTYVVYNSGTSQQFYADFSVQNNGSTRRFAITSGTLTITQVTAQGIAGNFTLESRVYFDWPRDVQPGTTATGVQTSQNLRGHFVAHRLSSFGY